MRHDLKAVELTEKLFVEFNRHYISTTALAARG
jgi:hypothetical protein